jgi:hypothetical protein
VQIPVRVDEVDNTPDGFHRRRCCQQRGLKCPKRVLTGLTKAPKMAHALAMNLMRRHLSEAEKCEISHWRGAERSKPERISQALDVREGPCRVDFDRLDIRLPTSLLPPAVKTGRVSRA